MVQMGEIAEGKKLLTTIGDFGERGKFPHRGLGRSPRSRRNFEHLIPNGVHFGLLFASQFSKVGGDRPTGVPACSKVGGDASHGSHRVVAPMADMNREIEIHTITQTHAV